MEVPRRPKVGRKRNKFGCSRDRDIQELDTENKVVVHGISESNHSSDHSFCKWKSGGSWEEK
ncbi:unnamed protein product [Dovyalis caffra]|uniref:Uncharacterized protein n=1 Tax=Dovyalis caffra TaxID=77055 RepID=A0AAV1RYI2_9ROSI|nr:unnamed protein product [Dovyalis caffra]